MVILEIIVKTSIIVCPSKKEEDLIVYDLVWLACLILFLESMIL